MARSVIRWDDPFSGLNNIHSQLDDIFNNFYSASALPAFSNMPAMDVYNDGDKQLIAEVHIPGFDKDDIEINVHDGLLEIKGQKHEKQEDKDKKRTYMVRESSASFYRRIALPKHADGNNVDAHFEKGVLKVVIPYKELPLPKKIQIKEGKAKK